MDTKSSRVMDPFLYVNDSGELQFQTLMIMSNYYHWKGQLTIVLDYEREQGHIISDDQLSQDSYKLRKLEK
jgi:hypothetical protein